MPNYVLNRLAVSGTSSRMWSQIAEFVKNDEDEENPLVFDFNMVIPMPDELDIYSGSKYEKLGYLYDHYCTPESKYSPLLGVSESVFESVRMSKTDWQKNGFPCVFDPEKDLTEEEKLLLSGKYPLFNGAAAEFSSLYIGYYLSQNQIFYGYSDWYNWRILHWGTKWNAMDAKLLDGGFGWLFYTAWSVPEQIVKTLSMIFPNPMFTLRYADEDFGMNCGEVTYQNGFETHMHTPEEGSDVARKFAERLWIGAEEA